jgi:hypothetical protein
MRLDVLALLLGGLGFVAFGCLMLVQPQMVMASIGLTLPDGVPTTEIRAFYGGLELGLGGLLLAALAQPGQRRHALLLGAVSYGAIGATRALSMLIEGHSSTFLTAAVSTELGLAALYVWALLAQQHSRA